ncbi:hypothetical protein PROFUN_14515 [Planoprotostelium fungivorum]|uniref:G8 domain-containing protein n=1 Tax=Planoprotostelium fungivorum TaxID=1890364 RepID=A0A2P6MZR2_9EUKA|nr:hypothetical protein PROFUN_14515 [Planoprotostelium fungivorum]
MRNGITLFGCLLCILITSACDYSGQTWSSTQPLKAGSNIVIPAGSRVLLDASPKVVYGSISISGTLVVANADVELSSEWIRVQNGGSLIVGTSDCPITKKVTITLNGLRGSTNEMGSDPVDGATFGTKGLIVATGGSVQMFGSINGPTWTRLSSTARNGTKTLQLEDSINWSVGDKVVIASTDFSEVLDFKAYQGKDDYKESIGQPFPDQNEVRTIAAVNGKQITLDAPLTFDHWGQGNEKAEVGLLTRRIVIKGDDRSASDNFGGHFLMRKGPITQVEPPQTLRTEISQISGVEFTQMGQQGILGRYPAHFHVMQDTTDVFFSSNSIHDTFQRAISVHESYNVKLENNVAFNVKGHMYFLEDGGEHNTLFHHNLGVKADPIGRETGRQLLPTDNRPAIFWITNPDNTWTDNAAVGGFHGYWFSMAEHPMAVGAKLWANSPWMWPRRLPLKKFDGNVAHSVRHTGLMIDDMQKADGTTEMGNYSPREGPYNDTLAGKPVTAVYNRFTAYKCRDSGVWGKGAGGRFTSLYLSDNSRAFMVNGNSLLENSIIVGETDNKGNRIFPYNNADRSYPDPWGNVNTILSGHSSYDFGGPQLLVNNKFVNFVSTDKRKAGALVSLAYGPYMNYPKNQLSQLTFDNANQVYIAYSNVDAQYGWNVIDIDGTTTGVKGGAWIQSNETHVRRQGCQLKSSWNAYVCPLFAEGYVQLATTLPGLPESSGLFRENSTDSRKVHVSFYPFGGKTDGPKGQSQGGGTLLLNNLIGGRGYSMKFTADDGTLGKSPKTLRLNMQSSSPGDFIIIGVPYPKGTTFQVKQQGYPYTVWTAAGSFADLSPTSYYYDSSTAHLYFLLINSVSGPSSYNSYHGYGVSDAGYYNPVDITANCGGCLVSPYVIPPVPQLPRGLYQEGYHANLLPTTTSNYTGTAFFYLTPDSFSGDVKLTYKIFHNVPGTTNKLSLNVGTTTITTKAIEFGNSAVQSVWKMSKSQWQSLVDGQLFVSLKDNNNKEILRGQIQCDNKCTRPPTGVTSNACKPSYGILPLYQDSNYVSPMQIQKWGDAKGDLNFTGDFLCGRSSMKISVTDGFFGGSWWANGNLFQIDPKYKYLEFYAKVVKGFGEYSFAVGAHNSSSALSTITTDRNKVDNYIIDEFQWTRVRISTGEMKVIGQTVKMLGFQNNVWPPRYTEFLIDEWRFAEEGGQRRSLRMQMN